MKIIGIDLGTTTSEIAYIKDGKPEIITNDLKEKVTPSVIGITEEGKYVVGEYAKRQLILKPNKTVAEVKTLIGMDKKIILDKRGYLPEEISAILLKELKNYAEQFLEDKVDEAVITVPANFNSLQRQATKRAGEMAGFKVDRIINEPTAAAMAYGLSNLENEEKVLVYDLGGGTFDVSVLELFSGILDVKASRGKNKLGGKDFDKRIVNYVVEEFKKTYCIDLSENIIAMSRIKDAAEKAKIELSYREETEINLPFVAVDKNDKPLEIKLKLTREKMDELIYDLISTTEKIIDDTIDAAGYTDEDIDVVLAVGGSSKMDCVRNLLKDRFGERLKLGVNPDEAVALGAAVQAGIKKDEISSEDGLIITDNCQYNLGISVVEYGEYGRRFDGIFDPLIKRDTKIPCTIQKNYYTNYDYQTEVIIEVYEGVSKSVNENIHIGSVVLTGIPSALKGEEALEVSFSYDLNGILEIIAKVISTGKSISAKFDLNGFDNSLVSISDFINTKKEEKGKLDEWKDSKLANEIKFTIEIAEKKLEKLDDDNKIEVGIVLNKLKKAVIENNKELVEVYDKKLTDMLFDLS
ncbi:molecular chaperone DnaK [Clostridium acidisoli DSM 12555]|uniref:Chaperone protein DnaK n=1 Tax=Clostridium acidisoli DSM 12555 TaxID=1121291 RepID=A0A1W1XIL3_9CLOT|nr:Hsp70 family protein [Clostridium acidisoli]SMC23813.1 molecular chaperone DnaK [Clostridium acidisoli DSM 12555]